MGGLHGWAVIVAVVRVHAADLPASGVPETWIFTLVLHATQQEMG